MTIIIGTPYTKHAGYLLNNKNDPKTRQEADMQSCAHCQTAINMQEWKKKGAWCAQEMKPLCISCGKRSLTFGCEPFLKKIEAYAEQQMRFARIQP